MAFTTTYQLQFVQNLDLDFVTGNSDVTSLSGTGGFAGLGDHTTHIDGNIFDANAVETDGWTSTSGTNGALDQLANGNIVIVSQDADSILFKVVSSVNGNDVVATIDIADVDSSNADVAALTGGRFVIVNQDEIGAVGGDSDIDIHIRNADGSAVTAFSVSLSLDRDTNAKVAALDNGDFAVTWQRDAGAETEIWYAVYNSAGGIVKAATLADSAGTVNRNPSITATNAGFAIAYEDNGWGTGTNDITLARFNAAGAFQGFTNVSNPNFINDGSNDANPDVTRLPNGLLAVTYGNNVFADTDTIVALLSADGATRLATRNTTAGESVNDDVDFTTVTGFGTLGHLAVFHTNLTDGDVDGEELQGVRTMTSDGAGDVMTGDGFIDIMYGGGGTDTLSGFANHDFLVGGAGGDTAYGGDGNDYLLMDDFLNPAAAGGADTGYGGNGNDLLWGYGGNDNLYGEANDDTLVGNDYSSNVAGNDGLYGGAGADTMFVGLGGNAYMDGGTGADIFYGGLLADVLRGGTGNDFLYGNAGGDNFQFYNFDFANGDADIIYFVDAGDRLQFNAALNGNLFFQNLASLEYSPGLFTTGVYITAFLGGGLQATITVYGATVASLTPMVEYTL